MIDERMTELLRAVARPTEPDPAFLERLYGDLATELGYRTPAKPSHGRPRHTPRWWLVAAALLVISLAGSALIAGAAVIVLEDRQPPDLLDAVRREGVLHVVVRDDFPQARSPEGALGGFDIDVATELARRLGVTNAVRAVPTESASIADGWQLSFIPGFRLAESHRYVASTPIYYWPIHVVVGRDSTVASLAALDGSSDVCVVAGTSGEAWLTGEPTRPSATSFQRPPDAAAVIRPDDESCLDALADGSVAAAVTADLGPAELAVRGAIRTLGGPVLTEARGVFVDPGTGHVDALLAAVDAAIEAARADGTLSDLARSRFGGHDLSVPPTLTPEEE